MPRADPIVRASRVRLVDDDYPNEKRQRVAEYIDEHWNDAGGLQLTDIAEECDVSRQHVKNTLEKHFKENVGEEEKIPFQTVDISERDTLQLVFEAYRMGYRDGARDSVDLSNRQDFKRLVEQYSPKQ